MASSKIESTKPKPLKGLTGRSGRYRGVGDQATTLVMGRPTDQGAPGQSDITKGYVVTDVGGDVGVPQSTAGDYYVGGESTGGTGGAADTVGGTMPYGYSPALYNQAFFNNPDAYAQDILARQGIDNVDLTNMLAPTVYGVNMLTSMLGADQPGEQLDPAAQANQVGAMIDQLLSPGGQALDPSAILGMLSGIDPNSAAAWKLNSVRPDQQIGMIMSVLDAAGGNPFQTAGIEAMLNQGLRDYNIDIAKGGQDQGTRPFWTGLAGGDFGKYFGG